MTPPPAAASVAELLGQRAAAAPDSTALEAPGSALTYRGWEARSNAAARGLARVGVRPGNRVAIVFGPDDWTDLGVAYVGAQKAGATAVPLGPRFGPVDLARVLADCAATVVVSPPTDRAVPLPVKTTSCTLADLEAGQRVEALLGVPLAAIAEIRYAPGPLHVADPFHLSHLELLARPLPAHPGTFLHGFAPGSAAATAALLAPLGPGRGPSVALGASGPLGSLDPAAFGSAVSTWKPAGAGVTSAAARALVASKASLDYDFSSLRWLVISADPGPDVLGALAVAMPQATVSVLDDGPVADRARGRPQRGAGTEVGPVAGSQVGMVWHEQFAPGSFNLAPLVRRYQGPLDLAAMESALSEIVARHDALRATFTMVDGEAVQAISPPERLVLPVVDLSGWEESARLAELDRLVAEARTRPVDLATGPLFAPTLVRLGPDDHAMIIRVHHSVFDDSSVGPFRAELSALYEAFVAGRPAPLARLGSSFAEVCRRERRALEGAPGAAERSFWRRELDGAPVTLELPIGDPDLPPGSALPAHAPVRVTMDAEVASALRDLARRERATVFMVTLAAFATVVGRYCDAEDLVMSTLIAGRDRRELEDMIGCFATKVVVRLSLAGDPSFVELIRRTRHAVMAAIGHKGLAFETVVQDNLGAVAAVHGLGARVSIKFQAAVSVRQRLSLPGLTIGPVAAGAPVPPPHFLSREPATGPARPAQVWGQGLYAGTFLGVSLGEDGEGLALVAEGVFHPPAVQRLLGHVLNVAADVARAPERPISTLEMLSSTDQEELRRWSAGPVVAAPAAGTGLHHLVGARARESPHGMALTGDVEVSWGDLDARAARLASQLHIAGAGPGSVVAVCIEDAAAAIVAVLAVWHTGAAYVGLDVAAGADRLGSVLADAEVGLAVADRPGAKALATLRPGMAIVDPDDWADSGRGEQRRAPMPATTGDLACVHYHQDHTGPVGVDIEHSSLINAGAGFRLAVTPGSPVRRLSGASPPDAAFLRAIAALGQGDSLHLGTPDPAEDPASVVSLLAAGDVDLVECTTPAWRDLVGAGLEAALAGRPPARPPATVIVATSGPPGAERPDDIPAISGVAVHHLYGPPECGFAAVLCPLRTAPARAGRGRPLANVSARVLDRAGRMVPVGVVGELHVGGAGVARGYHNRRGLDGERFVANHEDGGPLWRSGQRARLLPDGDLELLERLDSVVDLDGFAVEPARIQAALADCPGVERIAIVVREDPPGRRRLVAYVVPAAGSPVPTLGQLRRYLWTRLPGYAWPAARVIVDSLSSGPDTRLDPGALPAPTDTDADGYPVDAEEAVLGALWAEARGGDAGDPSRNYWQSFSFLDAVAAARQSGMSVDARRVTRNRTVQMLAVDLAAGATLERQPTGD